MLRKKYVETKEERKQWSWPFVALSYLLSAASLLNLIQDLSPVALYGKLKAWVDAYAQLIDGIGELLFSWLRIGWIGVSKTEHHVIAIGSLLGVSAMRATYKVHREWGYDVGGAWSNSQGFVVLYFLLAFTPCLLLPEHWGSAVAFVLVLRQALEEFRHEHSPWGPMSSQATGQAVLRELLGVVALVLIVIVVNNVFFGPGSDA